MLGRWQPWHRGHTELFKKAYEKTGQVCIMVRNMPISSNNPNTPEKVSKLIEEKLLEAGYKKDLDYIIIQVPNIVDISYGRDVGYSITQHDLGTEIHAISATKIRKEQAASDGSHQ
jgi:ATP sulfurylase